MRKLVLALPIAALLLGASLLLADAGTAFSEANAPTVTPSTPTTSSSAKMDQRVSGWQETATKLKPKSTIKP